MDLMRKEKTDLERIIEDTTKLLGLISQWTDEPQSEKFEQLTLNKALMFYVKYHFIYGLYSDYEYY